MESLSQVPIDKYARDAEVWRREAEATFEAATLLFDCGPSMWFSAAVLGHHAVEMLLKSALILAGCTVAKGKPEEGHVWGHSLIKLAGLFGSKRQDFLLQDSHLDNLARFDAFFNELRYPRALKDVDCVGPGREEAERLSKLMEHFRPFAFPLASEKSQHSSLADCSDRSQEV